MEAKLKNKIKTLEKQHIENDSILNVVNCYWTQLNEDIQKLLQRFDTETAEEFESKIKYNLYRYSV